MINHSFVRQALRSMGAISFVLFCCSFVASGQSQSETRRPAEIAQQVIFKDSLVKQALVGLGQHLKLNVVLDDAVRDTDRLTIELKDVTFEQAMKIIMMQKRLQAKTIEENTIIVFPDNETNRKRYAEYELWPAKSDGKK